MTYQEAIELVSTHLHLFNQRVDYRGNPYVVKALKVVPSGKAHTARVFLARANGEQRGTMTNESLETFLKKFKKAKRA